MRCPKCGLLVFSEQDLDPEFHSEEECNQIKQESSKKEDTE